MSLSIFFWAVSQSNQNPDTQKKRGDRPLVTEESQWAPNTVGVEKTVFRNGVEHSLIIERIPLVQSFITIICSDGWLKASCFNDHSCLPNFHGVHPFLSFFFFFFFFLERLLLPASLPPAYGSIPQTALI